MEEQIKKIYEKQKNGRIRMIRNVLLIYAALICVVSIFKGNPFPHQETVLFFDVKQPGWVTTFSEIFQKLTGFCHSNVMQKNIQKCWKS